jgi:2-dehydropantoate 2-reductase
VKYAVVGTGAIGGYYGGKLAQSGKEVHFFFHSDYCEVKKNGLRVASVGGDFILSDIHAYENPIDMPKCDVVLVGLKTTNNHILKTILPHLIHKDSIVILIQNGLGIEEDLARDMPGIHIAGGLAYICCYKSGSGRICHLDQGRINIGAFADTSKEVLRQVCADLEKAGVESHFVDDLLFSRWQKLIWNIPFNGMTVILGSTTELILKNSHSLSLINEMMFEVIEAANACGVPLQRSFADAMISSTMNGPAYSPSMKLDWDNHRQMEIEYIYTRPIQAALKSGFMMKKISMLEKQLRFLEETRL